MPADRSRATVGKLRNPDPDGVAMAAAATLGVLAGVAAGVGWALAVTVALAALLAGVLLAGGRPRGAPLVGGRPSRPTGAQLTGRGVGRSALAGALGLAALALAGAAVAGVRAAAVHSGVLTGLAGRGGTVTVEATVAEEPDAVRYGGRRVVLSVRRVEVAGRVWRTRERAGVVVPRGAGAVAVGDRLRLSAGVERSDRTDPLGGRPAVLLRRPRILSRSASRSRLLRASETVRAAVRERALAALPPDRAGLLAGIALGDTSLLPADLDQAFTAAGLTHLVAVSGQNVGVVLAAGLGVAVALGARRPLLAVLGILLVVLFALLTRWEPSVLRASAMAVLALAGVATGRGPGGRRALCLAVLLLLLANPALAWSLGFRLSVAATAGVLWLGPTAGRVLPGRLPDVVRSATGITLGAQAGALPVLALAFGQVSLAGLAANLVALPLATAPMLLGVVAAASATVAPPLATLACRLADPFLAALVAVADRAAALPAASLTLSGPARLLPAVAVAACTVLARRRAAALDRAAEDRRRRRLRYATRSHGDDGADPHARRARQPGGTPPETARTTRPQP